MFRVFTLTEQFHQSWFDALAQSVDWEALGKGRQAANLIHLNNDAMIPLVRTTSRYQKPSQIFQPIHQQLIQQIIQQANIANLQFNHATAELYDEQYKTMGYHSDQALDLVDDSYVAIFSCYPQPSQHNCRTLQIKTKDKTDQTVQFVTMTNHSVIIFSTAFNRQHVHRIVLLPDPENNMSNALWLGITFRLSKTFIRFIDHIPCLQDQRLTVATEQERLDFIRHKGDENKQQDNSSNQQSIYYTLSVGDTIEPTIRGLVADSRLGSN